MEDGISIDLGYNSAKVKYQDRVVKFPTAVSFASDTGVKYGDDEVYEFEGEKYYVGADATDEAFSTLDYKFLYKFGPVLVYHILHRFKKHQLKTPIRVSTGLAIVDWDKKDEFKERLSKITVNGNTINLQVTIMPQGAGCAIDWTSENGGYPRKLSVIDIGYNTINLLGFTNGKPVKKDMKSYPGHGVSSIIKPFTAFMENTFKLNFSEQECSQIFLEGEFTFNGNSRADVSEQIQQLKKQFVTKLFKSILVQDTKQLALSDVVLVAGGGAYLLQDVAFPPNVKFVNSPYEYANVRGYSSVIKK